MHGINGGMIMGRNLGNRLQAILHGFRDLKVISHFHCQCRLEVLTNVRLKLLHCCTHRLLHSSLHLRSLQGLAKSLNKSARGNTCTGQRRGPETKELSSLSNSILRHSGLGCRGHNRGWRIDRCRRRGCFGCLQLLLLLCHWWRHCGW